MPMRAQVMIAVGLAGLLLNPAPAAAKKKVWDEARYSSCLSTDGTDDLDEMLVITAVKCRVWYSYQEKSEGVDGTITLIIGASGAIPKDQPDTGRMGIAFALSVKASETAYRGNTVSSSGGGFFDLKSVTMLLDGERRRFGFVGTEQRDPRCSSFGRGQVAMANCEFPEFGSVMLEDADLDAIHRQYSKEPLGDLRLLIEGGSGGSIYGKMPLAEVVAVHNSMRARQGKAPYVLAGTSAAQAANDR